MNAIHVSSQAEREADLGGKLGLLLSHGQRPSSNLGHATRACRFRTVVVGVINRLHSSSPPLRDCRLWYGNAFGDHAAAISDRLQYILILVVVRVVLLVQVVQLAFANGGDPRNMLRFEQTRKGRAHWLE